jgi:hypothetical protein
MFLVLVLVLIEWDGRKSLQFLGGSGLMHSIYSSVNFSMLERKRQRGEGDIWQRYSPGDENS